jgi:hypothetical protein
MTQYRRAVVFAASTFCAIVAFCQAGEWKEYVYAEDGFAISSPVEPRIEKRTMKLIGGEVEAHFYYFPAPGLIMAVMYAPLLPNDKRAPEEALKGAKKSLDTSGATELEVEDSQYRQRGRFYAVERKIFTLVVSWPKDKPIPAEAERWCESFRLVSGGGISLENRLVQYFSCVAPLGLTSLFVLTHPSGFACARLQRWANFVTRLRRWITIVQASVSPKNSSRNYPMGRYPFRSRP